MIILAAVSGLGQNLLVNTAINKETQLEDFFGTFSQSRMENFPFITFYFLTLLFMEVFFRNKKKKSANQS